MCDYIPLQESDSVVRFVTRDRHSPHKVSQSPSLPKFLAVNIEVMILHFVGPRWYEWNLLRQTEGERFVDFLKRVILRKNFEVGKRKKDWKQL